MPVIPFDQLDDRILAMQKQLNKGLAAGMNNGFKKALKLSVTKYMVGGGGEPNPPPGPLKIRSGRLRRSVAVFPSRAEGTDIIIGGLQAGGGSVAYARIHEEGPRARPYLEPALKDATEAILRDAARGVVKVMRKFFDVS